MLANCVLVEGRDVDTSMHWHTECVMRMMFRSWSLACQIGVRERLEARCEELKFQTGNRPTGHHEKASVGRGGHDRAVLFQGPGRARDGGTARIGSAGTPPRGGRTPARAEETTPTRLEEIPSRRDQRSGYRTEHPKLWTQRQDTGQGGVNSRPAALVRVRRMCRSSQRPGQPRAG